MSLSFRPARPDDFDGVYNLLKELVGTIDVIHGEAGRARFQELLSHPGTQVMVAESAGALVGTATLHVLPNMTFAGRPYALLENVVTLKSAQGQGVGRGLMQYVLDAAWAVDCYKVMLLTGTAFGARGFYEKLGFEADSKHGMRMRRAPQRAPER